MKRKRIIWMIILIVLISGAIYGYREYTRKNKDLLYTKADFRMSASELLAVFEKNDSAAGALYNGKFIEITGPLKTAEEDEHHYVTLVLSDSAGLSSIRCSMDTSHRVDIKTLHPAAIITIRGACTGYNKDEMGLGSDLFLNRGVLIEKK